jgi:hypothetical protein
MGDAPIHERPAEAAGGGVLGGRLATIALDCGRHPKLLQEPRTTDVRHDHDGFVRFTMT